MWSVLKKMQLSHVMVLHRGPLSVYPIPMKPRGEVFSLWGELWLLVVTQEVVLCIWEFHGQIPAVSLWGAHISNLTYPRTRCQHRASFWVFRITGHDRRWWGLEMGMRFQCTFHIGIPYNRVCKQLPFAPWLMDFSLCASVSGLMKGSWAKSVHLQSLISMHP